MNTHIWLSKILTGLISIGQASTLRDRYYSAEQRIEILVTALDDIARINANSADPNSLIAGICDRVKPK
jgi:hypothetical protein